MIDLRGSIIHRSFFLFIFYYCFAFLILVVVPHSDYCSYHSGDLPLGGINHFWSYTTFAIGNG